MIVDLQEILLWPNGMDGVSGALRHGFNASLAQLVKELVLLQLWHNLQLQVSSDPWLGDSLCFGVTGEVRNYSGSIISPTLQLSLSKRVIPPAFSWLVVVLSN